MGHTAGIEHDGPALPARSFLCPHGFDQRSPDRRQSGM